MSGLGHGSLSGPSGFFHLHHTKSRWDAVSKEQISLAENGGASGTIPCFNQVRWLQFLCWGVVYRTSIKLLSKGG